MYNTRFCVTSYWVSSLNSSLTTLPFGHCVPVFLASLLFLRRAIHILASASLCWLCLQCSSLDAHLTYFLPSFSSALSVTHQRDLPWPFSIKWYPFHYSFFSYPDWLSFMMLIVPDIGKTYLYSLLLYSPTPKI